MEKISMCAGRELPSTLRCRSRVPPMLGRQGALAMTERRRQEKKSNRAEGEGGCGPRQAGFSEPRRSFSTVSFTNRSRICPFGYPFSHRSGTLALWPRETRISTLRLPSKLHGSDGCTYTISSHAGFSTSPDGNWPRPKVGFPYPILFAASSS